MRKLISICKGFFLICIALPALSQKTNWKEEYNNLYQIARTNAELLQYCSEENSELKELIVELQQKVLNPDCSDFEKMVAQQKETIRQNSRTISSLNSDNENLRKQLIEKEQKIKQLQKTLSETELERDRYKFKVDSIKAVEDELLRRRLNAETNLNEANRQFERFSILHKNNKSTPAAIDDFRKVWSTYQEYDKYKRCKELLNAAKILVYNEGLILDILGDTQAESLNRRSSLILDNIGRLLNNPDCSYNDRSEIAKLVSRLPNIILIEQNDKVKKGEGNIRRVHLEYLNGNYAEALSLYNLYESLLSGQSFKNESLKIEVIKAKFGVGHILLWDLGQISVYKELTFQESWLGKTFNSFSTRESEGRRLLLEIIDENKIIDKAIKDEQKLNSEKKPRAKTQSEAQIENLANEASILLAKFYRP